MKKLTRLFLIFLAAVTALTSLCAVSGAVKAPELTETSLTLSVGETYQLYVNYAVDSITWSSGNQKVASVSKGLVTAKKEGSATITAKHGSTKLRCRVTVRAAEKQYTFRSKKLFDQHYKKHGAEFGKITQEQYLAYANELINSASADVLHKTSSDGDSLFFDKNKGWFAVLSADGYIRTFFIPDSGIKYWNRQ